MSVIEKHRRSLSLRCILPSEHILSYTTFYGVTILNKAVNRDSKSEDLSTSVNFLTILFYEFTYPSKIKGFCKHSVMMLKIQPNLLQKLSASPMSSAHFPVFLPGCIARVILQAELTHLLFFIPVRFCCVEEVKDCFGFCGICGVLFCFNV